MILILLIPILSLYVITGYKVIPSIMKILNILQTIKASKFTVDILYSELKKVLQRKNQHKKPRFTFEKNINLSNISFSYAGRKIIKDFSIIIEKNSCVGIIGKSGLVNLQ